MMSYKNVTQTLFIQMNYSYYNVKNLFTWDYPCTKKWRFPVNVFSKCDHIHRKLRIWSNLMEKFLMKNLIFYQCIPCHASQMLIFSKISWTVMSARTMFFSCTTVRSSCQEVTENCHSQFQGRYGGYRAFFNKI